MLSNVFRACRRKLSYVFNPMAVPPPEDASFRGYGSSEVESLVSINMQPKLTRGQNQVPQRKLQKVQCSTPMHVTSETTSDEQVDFNSSSYF